MGVVLLTVFVVVPLGIFAIAAYTFVKSQSKNEDSD